MVFSFGSDQNIPDTLFDQCIKFIVNHIECLASADPVTNELELREGLSLPSEICDALIEVYQQNGKILDDRFINIFENPERARLKRVKLRRATINDDSLCLLLNHNLIELDIANCTTLTEGSLAHLNEKGDSLISLSLGSYVQVLPDSLIPDIKFKDDVSGYEKRGYILRAPNLRRFTVKKLHIPEEKIYFPLLLKPLKKLTHLDLSGCFDLRDLSYLEELPLLISLILHNMLGLTNPAALASVKKLKGLRHLDVSQSNDKNGMFGEPDTTLASLVENLPLLVSLDISGTNLAGRGVQQPSMKKDSVDASVTDIPGLRSRVNYPFEFLGLYHTAYEACRRYDIPAKRIAGDANEEQILNAAVAYIDRPEVLQKVLNDLYHLFRYESCTNNETALKIVLESMDRHVQEKHIQISGSATLFYIAKMKAKKASFKIKMKHHMIRVLLNAMSAFQDDETMMRNGCLTLCQFNMPEDVLFDYERLVHILLYVVTEMEQESFVQRIGIYLLNSLACQVDGSQKQLLGDLGAISKMLSIITDRLERQVCDDVLEVAWSTMWNVTDETAVNCQRFLEGGGMELFLGCLGTFANKEELLRNMMGLLGNVAEVKSLRPRLMTDTFVAVFSELLDSYCDGIEVSYNAAGVLAHMSSDGVEAWTISEPKREKVLKKMVTAIERWELSTERNINYRSFQPILSLLKIEHTPECQHWAAWALANLTTVYPKKYCTLVESEGGVILLEDVIRSEFSYLRIKELARIVINNCQRFKENGDMLTDHL